MLRLTFLLFTVGIAYGWFNNGHVSKPVLPTADVHTADVCNPNRDGNAPDQWCDATCVASMESSYFNLMHAFMADCDVFISYFAPDSEDPVLQQAGVTFRGRQAIYAQCQEDVIRWPQTTPEFVDTTYTSGNAPTVGDEKKYYVMGTVKQGLQNLTNSEIVYNGVRNELIRATANQHFLFTNVRIIYDVTLIPGDGPKAPTPWLNGQYMASQYLQLMNRWKAQDCERYSNYFALNATLYDNGLVYTGRDTIREACVQDTKVFPSIGFSWDVNYTNADQGNSIGTRPYGKFGNATCIAMLNQVIIVTFYDDYSVASLEALFPMEYWYHACSIYQERKRRCKTHGSLLTPARQQQLAQQPNTTWNKWIQAGRPAWHAAAGFTSDSDEQQFALEVGVSNFITPWDTASYYYGIIQAANNNYALANNPLFFVYARETHHIIATVDHANQPSTYNGTNNYRPEVVVRSGGHSMLSFSTPDNGIIVDISNMTDMWFDRTQMQLTAQAGTTFDKFNSFAAMNGVHAPGGSCDSVALGGYHGGGGYGITSRMYGMGCYNIREISIILANGSLITANDQQHTELLWAQCGGGNNNYGIVVNMTFNVTTLMPLVWNIEYRWDISASQEVITMFQNYVPFQADQRLGLYLEFSQYNNTPPTDAPYPTPQPGSYLIAAIGMFWANASNPATQQEAIDAMKPFDAIAKGLLQFRKFTAQPYNVSNSDQFDGIEWAMPYTWGKPYWEYKYSSVVHQPLTADHIQGLVEVYKKHPVYNVTDSHGNQRICCGSEISFEVYGGAISRGPHWTQRLGGVYQTWSHQNAYFDVFASAYYTDEHQNVSTKAWAESFWTLMQDIYGADNGPPVYRNYPVLTSQFKNKAPDAFMYPYYQNSADTLKQIKAQYDPTNFFHYAQSIPLPDNSAADGKCAYADSAAHSK